MNRPKITFGKIKINVDKSQTENYAQKDDNVGKSKTRYFYYILSN